MYIIKHCPRLEHINFSNCPNVFRKKESDDSSISSEDGNNNNSNNNNNNSNNTARHSMEDLFFNLPTTNNSNSNNNSSSQRHTMKLNQDQRDRITRFASLSALEEDLSIQKARKVINTITTDTGYKLGDIRNKQKSDNNSNNNNTNTRKKKSPPFESINNINNIPIPDHILATSTLPLHSSLISISPPFPQEYNSILLTYIKYLNISFCRTVDDSKLSFLSRLSPNLEHLIVAGNA